MSTLKSLLTNPKPRFFTPLIEMQKRSKLNLAKQSFNTALIGAGKGTITNLIDSDSQLSELDKQINFNLKELRKLVKRRGVYDCLTKLAGDLKGLKYETETVVPELIDKKTSALLMVTKGDM